MLVMNKILSLLGQYANFAHFVWLFVPLDWPFVPWDIQWYKWPNKNKQTGHKLQMGKHDGNNVQMAKQNGHKVQMVKQK